MAFTLTLLLRQLTDDGHDDVDVGALNVRQERQDVVENDHLVQTVQQTVNALESVQPRLSQNTRRRNSSRTTACPLSRIKVRPTALLRQHEPAGLLRCRWPRTRYAARVTPIHTSQHKTEINCQLVIQWRACYRAADVVTGETYYYGHQLTLTFYINLRPWFTTFTFNQRRTTAMIRTHANYQCHLRSVRAQAIWKQTDRRSAGLMPTEARGN